MCPLASLSFCVDFYWGVESAASKYRIRYLLSCTRCFFEYKVLVVNFSVISERKSLPFPYPFRIINHWIHHWVKGFVNDPGVWRCVCVCYCWIIGISVYFCVHVFVGAYRCTYVCVCLHVRDEMFACAFVCGDRYVDVCWCATSSNKYLLLFFEPLRQTFCIVSSPTVQKFLRFALLAFKNKIVAKNAARAIQIIAAFCS